MSVSDTLSDAVEYIRSYQRDWPDTYASINNHYFPETYASIKAEIDAIVIRMDVLRRRMDNPPNPPDEWTSMYRIVSQVNPGDWEKYEKLRILKTLFWAIMMTPGGVDETNPWDRVDELCPKIFKLVTGEEVSLHSICNEKFEDRAPDKIEHCGEEYNNQQIAIMEAYKQVIEVDELPPLDSSIELLRVRLDAIKEVRGLSNVES